MIRIRSAPRRSGARRSVTALIAGLFFCAIGGSVVAEEMVNPGPYPEPRFPKFLVDPTGEQLLQAARVAVRQTEGYCPLGLAESGQTVHVFLTYDQDMEVWEVIKEAWAERDVMAVAVRGWEALGMSREDYVKRAEAAIITGDDGWKEFGVFDPAYLPFLPADVQEQIGKPLTVLWRYAEQSDYMKNHPEIEHVFVGSGGGADFWSYYVGREHRDKFLGSWVYLKKADLMSKAPYYPSDVWKMVDEHIVRPIPHVEEGMIHDPEGTRLHWTMTPRQSAIWDEASGLSSYSAGHLNIYPAMQHATLHEGVIRAGANHTAFYPTMTVHLSKHGRVTRVEAGGKAGDLFRYLNEHPKLKNAELPGAPEPEKGYWYLTQDGLGTNPKTVRNMQQLFEGAIEMPNLIERRRAGVQHFSFSSPVGIAQGGDISPEDLAYAEERGIPLQHTGHMHVYFPTVKWKLRDTGEWITVVDKGMLEAFENPEIRALAARYGDPDVLFSYDWIPTLPGINVPGDYERDYAPDPWSWISSVWEDIKNDSYQYYLEDYEVLADPVAAQN